MATSRAFSRIGLVLPVLCLATSAAAEDYFRPAITETRGRLVVEIEDADGERYGDDLERAKGNPDLRGLVRPYSRSRTPNRNVRYEFTHQA